MQKYIPLLDQTEIGSWVIDTENDGTIEHPIQFPFVAYSSLVSNFTKVFCALIVGAVRAERFCDGALLFTNGSIMRWLLRLPKIVERTNNDIIREKECSK